MIKAWYNGLLQKLEHRALLSIFRYENFQYTLGDGVYYSYEDALKKAQEIDYNLNRLSQ